MKNHVILLLLLALIGCQSTETVVDPISIVGGVENLRFTGFYRDVCENYDVVSELPGSEECLYIGHEIYTGILSNALDRNGKPVPRFRVAMMGHALTRNSRAQKEYVMYLQPAPEILKEAEHIDYLIAYFEPVVSDDSCYPSHPFVHALLSDCPDLTKHEVPDECVSEQRFLDHYYRENRVAP